ncbi:hypothetical protein QTP88_024010 [Uroleucon formosanum]
MVSNLALVAVVSSYSTRIKTLFHELCNASVVGKTAAEAMIIREHIKGQTLAIFIEGLRQPMKTIIKAGKPASLELAIKESLEEERVYKSNKESQRFFNNPKPGGKTRYCSRWTKYIDGHVGKRRALICEGRTDGAQLQAHGSGKGVYVISIGLVNKHAKINIPQCHQGSANLLLDTGAYLNLIKLDTLSDNVKVNTDQTYSLQGIHKTPVNTTGSVLLDIHVGNSTQPTEFQVIPMGFPIPQDGIMGRPLLEQLKVVIDCNQGTLTWDIPTNEITVPPRSQVVIPVCTTNVVGDNQDILIHSQQLAEDLFCGNVLNTVQNGQVLVCIANSREEPIQMEPPHLDELSHQLLDEAQAKTIFNIRKADNRLNRIDLLQRTLRLDHTNKEERKSVENIYLFEATQNYALALCISEDLDMSRGLALEFNRRFGHTDHEGQKLLYLITKEKCFQKPMYENLYKTLQTLRSKTEQELISHIAMPRIGCGLDQLDWDTVKAMIKYEKEKSKALYDRNAKSITVHVGDKVLTKWHAKKGKLTDQYNITQFDNPSMYYHAMGNLCITDTYWNLLTYVNLKNYDKQIRMIDEGIKHVTQECKKFFEIATACEQFVVQTSAVMQQIESNPNVLFGICDDSDAEKFYNQINEFNQFNLSTSHLMQSQTTIIRNMVNDINETMQRVAKQAEVVNELITHERVTEMQSNCILKISLLSIKVENLVDIVNYATLGHIHSSIMSPKTITQQMSDIKSKLPPNSEFPLETTTITVISVDDLLIFSIEIPITNGMRFIIYEVIPLPMQLTQDQVIIIEAKSTYLAVDKTQKNFISFEEHQLTICIVLKDAFVCPNEYPIDVNDQLQDCEQNLFNSPPSIPSSCNKKILLSKPTVWHRLAGENTWLFVVKNEAITIPCENEIQSIRVTLNNIGKISINPKCKLYTKNNILIPTRKFKSKIFIDFFPNIPLNVIPINFNNTGAVGRHVSNNRGIQYNFKNLARDAEDLKSLQEQINTELNNNNNKQQRHTYTTTTVTIIVITITIIILVIIYLLYRKLSTLKNKWKPGGTGSPNILSSTLSTNTEAKPIACTTAGARAKSLLPEII